METSQHPPIEVNVIEGKASYVHVELKEGLNDHAFLTNTTEDEYNKRKPKLKPLKEWRRVALGTAQSPDSNELTPAPSQVGSKAKDKHSGKFGDLAVNVSKLVLTPNQYEKRARLEAFVNVANTGKGVICAEFDVTLNTTFGLQYLGASWHAPKMKEMLPGESAEGSYAFDIKDGVQPLDLVISLKRRRDGRSSVGTIRCGSDFPFRDVFVSDEIRLNIRDLPIMPSSSE